ncbi:MAG: SDR family oxidoreductase [Magnetospirillum sp. WYHS-4]
MTRPRLFCFGLGYSARVLAARLRAAGWAVAGTTQHPDKRAALEAEGYQAFLMDRGHPLADAAGALAGTTHLLSSVPPDSLGDAVLDQHLGDLRAIANLAWAGYLSTTGVYGDTGGAVVDETALVAPTSERSRRRAEAEARWRVSGLPIHVFRLPGIYGPGSSALDKVRAGEARRIDRPGHRFCRIHVEDIAEVLTASMRRPNPGAVYNVCDDEPASPAEVTAFACRLLGMEPPPLEPFAEAAKAMSAMALSFWNDNRAVANGRIKQELGVVLKYPDYRTGLAAIRKAESPGSDRR